MKFYGDVFPGGGFWETNGYVVEVDITKDIRHDTVHNTTDRHRT